MTPQETTNELELRILRNDNEYFFAFESTKLRRSISDTPKTSDDFRGNIFREHETFERMSEYERECFMHEIVGDIFEVYRKFNVVKPTLDGLRSTYLLKHPERFYKYYTLATIYNYSIDGMILQLLRKPVDLNKNQCPF